MQSHSPAPSNKHKGGRPTKKTKQNIEAILKAVATGAPYSICCAAVGINPDTFAHWKRTDPVFAMQIEQVAAQTALKLWHKIEEHGEKEFQAISWLLERRFPNTFSRPEVQLNLAIQQNNILAQGANGNSFESVIVADLEFLGLAKREGYQHRPREVEATVSSVPENLSGVLARYDHPNGAIISESQAEENARRAERSRAKIAALLAAKVGQSVKTEEPEGVEPAEAAGALVPGTITLPTGLASASWWRQFCEGDISRTVARDAANWICGQLLGETLGAGQSTRIEFDADATVAEVIDALERVAGPRARAMLMKKAGMA